MAGALFILSPPLSPKPSFSRLRPTHPTSSPWLPLLSRPRLACAASASSNHDVSTTSASAAGDCGGESSRRVTSPAYFPATASTPTAVVSVVGRYVAAADHNAAVSPPPDKRKRGRPRKYFTPGGNNITAAAGPRQLRLLSLRLPRRRLCGLKPRRMPLNIFCVLYNGKSMQFAFSQLLVHFLVHVFGSLRMGA